MRRFRWRTDVEVPEQAADEVALVVSGPLRPVLEADEETDEEAEEEPRRGRGERVTCRSPQEYRVHRRRRMDANRPPALTECLGLDELEESEESDAPQPPEDPAKECVTETETTTASASQPAKEEDLTDVVPLDLDVEFLVEEERSRPPTAQSSYSQAQGSRCGSAAGVPLPRSKEPSVNLTEVTWEDVEDVGEEEALPTGLETDIVVNGQSVPLPPPEDGTLASLSASSLTGRATSLLVQQLGGGVPVQPGTPPAPKPLSVEDLAKASPPELQDVSAWKRIHDRLEEHASRAGSRPGSAVGGLQSPAAASQVSFLDTLPFKATTSRADSASSSVAADGQPLSADWLRDRWSQLKPASASSKVSRPGGSSGTPENFVDITSASAFKAKLANVQGVPVKDPAPMPPCWQVPGIAVVQGAAPPIKVKMMAGAALPPPPDWDPPESPDDHLLPA